jgi:hypothetical protein
MPGDVGETTDTAGFVRISEQTAIVSLYSINWLVFITETECVYCAVRTGSLNIILRSAHTVCLCVLCGSQNKQRLFLYTALTDWFFITETECVYCVVRTGSSRIMQVSFKGRAVTQAFSFLPWVLDKEDLML